MLTYIVGLDVNFALIFTDIHPLCMQAVKALAGLPIYARWP